MVADYRKLTEEAFDLHWRLQLDLGEPISAIQMRLAEELSKHGYKLSLPAVDEVSRQPHRGVEREAKNLASASIKLDDYEWIAASPELKSRLLAELNLVDAKYQVSEATKIDTCTLDWYPEYKLIRLTDDAWGNPRLHLYYLGRSAFDLLRLAGTSAPIHEVSAKAPIRLTVQNVLSYLVFFCFFVRGDEGPFMIAESMDNSLIDDFRFIQTNQQMKERALSVIEGNVCPAVVDSVTEDGDYLCHATILYARALFKAQFSVKPTGMIEMLEDEPIAADMPFSVNAPIG